MILTVNDLKNKYMEYSDIQGKIQREVKENRLYPLVRGLYENNPNIPGYYLTSYIYGPSYISFDYALYLYGLIPEKVITYTCASFNKRKSKMYKNFFGNYVYRDIPKLAFPYDIEIHEEKGYIFHLATKEKALCDKLYDLKPVKSIKQLRTLLFDDLRIDVDGFNQLDKKKLNILIPKYHSTNLWLLQKMIKE